MDNQKKEELLKKYNKLFEYLSQDSKSRVILIRLGDVCMELGQREESLIFYKRAISFGLNPEDIEQKLKVSFSEQELEGIEFPVKMIPFWQKFGEVSRYPFTMQGIILIFVGAFGFTLANFILFIIGGMLSALADSPQIRIFIQRMMPLYLLSVSFYILAYLVKIIQSTASGDEEFPDWLDFSDFWSLIIRPFVQVIITATVSYFLAILVIIFISPSSFGGTVLLLLCFFVGSLYFPMSLIVVVRGDAFLVSLNFSFIVRSILKIRKHYFIALLTLWIFGIISTVLYFILIRSGIPIIGLLIFWVISIYFTLVEGYILGNLYYINRRELNF